MNKTKILMILFFTGITGANLASASGDKYEVQIRELEAKKKALEAEKTELQTKKRRLTSLINQIERSIAPAQEFGSIEYNYLRHLRVLKECAILPENANGVLDAFTVLLEESRLAYGSIDKDSLSEVESFAKQFEAQTKAIANKLPAASWSNLGERAEVAARLKPFISKVLSTANQRSSTNKKRVAEQINLLIDEANHVPSEESLFVIVKNLSELNEELEKLKKIYSKNPETAGIKEAIQQIVRRSALLSLYTRARGVGDPYNGSLAATGALGLFAASVGVVAGGILGSQISSTEWINFLTAIGGSITGGIAGFIGGISVYQLSLDLEVKNIKMVIEALGAHKSHCEQVLSAELLD